MSLVDYIDLCDNDIKNNKPEPVDLKVNSVSFKTSNLPFRPKTVALKCIGLSLIKMQYNEKFLKPLTNSSQNGINKPNIPKSDVWNSVWTDEDNSFCRRYPLRHILEQKFDKSCKCPHSRSAFCQNSIKMSRIQWIHHVRRGHIRIDYEWRRSLKRNQHTGISNIFEVFCVLCSKNRKITPITPNDFIQHMKKLHPHFLPYTDYFTYFQRCYICNDDTKSFQQNITHRQMCITAVNNDPNQVGTANFNNCFQNQLNKSIVSVELENDFNKSFENKLKTFTFFRRTTLHYWLSRKKVDSRKSTFTSINGNNNQDQITNKFNMFSSNSIKSQIDTNQYLLTNSVFTLSERITPGTVWINSNERFFMPVPFPLRNEIAIKKSYNDWCKLIHPRNSRLAKVNPLYCELCNAMVKNLNTVYYHLKMCHPGITFAENQCKSCDKRFITQQGYKMHFKSTKRCPVARKCGICNQSVSVNDIYFHLYDKHKNNFGKVLQLTCCLICRENITDLVKHLFDVHGLPINFQTQLETGLVNYRNGSFFNCIKCSLTFFTEIELRNHMINTQHHFECPMCPELKFYLFWELINHKNIVHIQDIEELTCELCTNITDDENTNFQEIKFSKPSEKVTHFLSHHNSNCCVVLSKMEDVSNSEA